MASLRTASLSLLSVCLSKSLNLTRSLSLFLARTRSLALARPPGTPHAPAPPQGSASPVGKRVTNIDKETDRMARLFLGKENEEQARRRLKIVQARAVVE